MQANCSKECECLATKNGHLIELQSEVETYISEQIDGLGGTLKILDLIIEDENLEGFKDRLTLLKHLAHIDLKAIKRAYEPAIREIGLHTWKNFSEDNKVQLTMIKMLSLEERISGTQPANSSQTGVINSLIESFEQFRFDTEQKMDQMQVQLAKLAKENEELRSQLLQ